MNLIMRDMKHRSRPTTDKFIDRVITIFAVALVVNMFFVLGMDRAVVYKPPMDTKVLIKADVDNLPSADMLAYLHQSGHGMDFEIWDLE